MSLATQAQRIAARNPLEPYSWELRLTGYDARRPGGHRIKQHDVDGYHTSRDVNRPEILQRVQRLVIWGHPASPIECHLPEAPWPFGAAPDEIILRATTDIRETIERGTGEKAWARQTWCFFGYRYGADYFILQFDPAGHLLRTNYPAPMACARCGP